MCILYLSYILITNARQPIILIFY